MISLNGTSPRRSMEVLSDPVSVDIETGLPESDEGAHANLESSKEHEEDDLVLVVTNPKLADIIRYTCVGLASFSFLLLVLVNFRGKLDRVN
jgi:hypothetical protein